MQGAEGLRMLLCLRLQGTIYLRDDNVVGGDMGLYIICFMNSQHSL